MFASTAEPTVLSTQTKINVENLDVYYATFHAIRNASLHVPAHRVMALIGPSGCGKSTFLRALNRMHDLTPGARVEGRVLLDERNIYAPDVDPVTIRYRIGMVFQRPNPFPKSIYDNVVYGPRIHGIRNRQTLMDICERSLRQAALWDEVRGSARPFGARALRWTAAAALHRALPGGRSRGHLDGRTGLGARSNRNEQDRRSHRRSQKSVHRRDRDALDATSGAN